MTEPAFESVVRTGRKRRSQSKTALKHDELRDNFKSFADYLKATCPEGRYLDLVLTELEGVSMWAHKALSKTAPFESRR